MIELVFRFVEREKRKAKELLYVVYNFLMPLVQNIDKTLYFVASSNSNVRLDSPNASRLETLSAMVNSLRRGQSVRAGVRNHRSFRYGVPRAGSKAKRAGTCKGVLFTGSGVPRNLPGFQLIVAERA
jgi:hypothetical protein